MYRSLRNSDARIKEVDLNPATIDSLFPEGCSIEEIFNVLRGNSSVTTMHVNKFNMTPSIMASLSEYLRGNCYLKSLDISRNTFCDTSLLSQIFSALENNKSLTKLDISGNFDIGSAGNELAVVLKSNAVLEVVVGENTFLKSEVWVGSMAFNSTLLALEASNGNDEHFKVGGILHRMTKTNAAIMDLKYKPSNLVKARVEKEVLLSSVRDNHIAAVYEIVNMGLNIQNNTDIVKQAVENHNLVILKLLLSVGAMVPSELLVQKFDNNILNILKRNNKEVLDFSQSLVSMKYLPDNLPKSITSVDLSSNGIHSSHLPLLYQKLMNLPKLTHLDLSYNKITDLCASNLLLLTSLKSLNVENNSLISLDPSIEEHKGLRNLECSSNPLVETIPEDIIKKGHNRILQYLTEQKSPSKNWNRLKLLVVGPENVGKSHLVSCLSGKKREDKGNLCTDGVAIELTTIKKISFLIHDFGGQEIFHPSQKFFMTDRAIYLVVFNLAERKTNMNDYWLKKIKCYSKKLIPPPVIIVGTHQDQCEPTVIEEEKNNMAKLKKSYPNIAGWTFLNCLNTNLTELKNLIGGVATKHKIITDPVPPAYFSLDRLITQEKANQKVMKWEEYQKLCAKVHLDPKTIETATEFFHDVGTLLWFNQSQLKHMVILDTQWLASVMSGVISFKSNWKNGVVPMSTLQIIWKDVPEEMQKTLLSILISFEIVFPFGRDKRKLIIPSLLPSEPDFMFTAFISQSLDRNLYNQIQRVYKFEFLPLGFFPQLIARMIQVPEMRCYKTYRNGFLICPNIDAESFRESNPDILKYGYSQGYVKYKDYQTYSSLTINIWKPLKYSSNAPNLLFHTSYVVESLLRDDYRKFEDSIQRNCSIITETKTLSYTYEELLMFFRSGKTFLNLEDELQQISISELAPDISFESVPIINNEDILILEELGQGGTGVVYKGLLKLSKKEVAVKELRPIGVQDNESEYSSFGEFQHEVYMMSGLSSPYLVELIGIQVSPLRMVLEYVPGRDLSEILHDQSISNDQFSWTIRRKIAVDIAMGLYHLHECINPPIMHRDLRSPNCFVLDLDINSSNVNCKVADFGLAQRMYVTSSERLLTWQWMPPEVLDDSSPYDQRADIFSYGTVLWEICSRAFPYDEYDCYKTVRKMKLTPEQINDGHTINEMTFAGWDIDLQNGEGTLILMSKHKFGDLIVKEDLRPTIGKNVPQDIQDIILKCWSKNPDHRPDIKTIIITLTAALPSNCIKEVNRIIFKPSPRISIPPNKEPHATVVQHQQLPADKQVQLLHNHLEELPNTICCMIQVDDTVWVGCADGKIYIFEIKSGKLISRISAHKNDITSLAVVNNVHVWSGGSDSSVFIYKRKKRTRKSNKHLKGHSGSVVSILGLETEKDKKSMTVWTADSEGTIIIWKGETKIKKIAATPITSMVYNQSHVWVNTKLPTQTILFDTSTHSAVKVMMHSEYTLSHIFWVNGLVWVNGNSSTTKIYEPETLETNEIKITSNHITKVNKNYVWIIENSSVLNIFDVQKKILIKGVISLSDYPIVCTVSIDESQIWTASQNIITVWLSNL